MSVRRTAIAGGADLDCSWSASGLVLPFSSAIGRTARTGNGHGAAFNDENAHGVMPMIFIFDQESCTIVELSNRPTVHDFFVSRPNCILSPMALLTQRKIL